jgi:class 3 adenylate cyclase
MGFPGRWLYERFPRRYLLLYVVFDLVSAAIICLATVGLFSLYESMSEEKFWRLVVVSELATAIALGIGLLKARRRVAPLARWMKAGGPARDAVAAWRTAVTLPRDYVWESGWVPFALIAVPLSIYFPLELDLPIWSAVIVFGGALVAVAYAAVLHFFASEAFLRPVLEDIARRLPADFAPPPEGISLRWKLLGALPIINVITGVVVSGLSTDGAASLEDLGFDVVVALVVAFTISLELTVLVARSVLRPVDDLLAATEHVKRGDLDVRVPVISGDEMGELAGSFNEMMRGLSERETLREAFGSYVDPGVAQRVLEEGELLEGREVEVTVLFVDIRDFTPVAERGSARETVAFLNDFFDLVVPIVLRHRGHANKFLGDGLLAVFGAPERLADHADRALRAAIEIVAAVEQRWGGDVRVGIGLNSGPVVVGSVGGGGRLEFTVIGDPVNTAARVERATRETGDAILATEATRCLLRDGGRGLERRGELSLKGKAEPVGIYAAGVDERSTPGPRPLKAEA